MLTKPHKTLNMYVSLYGLFNINWRKLLDRQKKIIEFFMYHSQWEPVTRLSLKYSITTFFYLKINYLLLFCLFVSLFFGGFFFLFLFFFCFLQKEKNNMVCKCYMYPSLYFETAYESHITISYCPPLGRDDVSLIMFTSLQVRL